MTLSIRGSTVVGEVALEIGPATVARDRDRSLDDALAVTLTELSSQLGVVLAAAPHRYARPIPGKDEAGLTRFLVRGRVEGDCLVPDVQLEVAKRAKRSR